MILMIRLEKALPKTFLLGIVELVDLIGAEKTCEWLQIIGKQLAETEGAGFEGAREGDLNYLPICPFANELQEFIEMYGKRPEQFYEIINKLSETKYQTEKKAECPAIASILCIMHDSYRRRRAELAGKKVLHLACHSKVTSRLAYNENAIKAAGLTKSDVDKLLKKSTCIFKYV